MSLNSVLARIKNAGLEFIRFELCDIFGISRSRIVPARHFKEKASNGIAVALSQMVWVIDGSDILIHTPYRDGVIGLGDVTWRPDMNTFQVLPWCSKTATIFLEPTDNGKPVSFYPRFIARKQIERLDKLRLSLLAAHEHEFYVVSRESGKPFTQDTMLRATVRHNDSDFLYQLMRDLYKVGIDVDMADTEQGPGQVEITYKPTFGIQAADNAHLFKTSVKEIAQKHGYIASFMSKPYKDKMGSSAHLNHSLWDREGKRNLFDDTLDTENPTRMSEIGQHWMAGILNHSRALSMIMAPTVCYKRGAESCVNSEPSWGFDNRTCMLRVKSTAGTYIENRRPGAGSNPYLTLAVTIAAGIDGIERKLQLPPEETGYSLLNSNHGNSNKKKANAPSNLKEAMDEFKADDVMKNAFGVDFCEAFFALKAYEIKLGQTKVDASEEDKYVLERKMYFNYL